MGFCDGWGQALALSVRLMDEGKFDHARDNLRAVKRAFAIFATPESMAQLTPEQRSEIAGLMNDLAKAWRRLAASARKAAASDAQRLAG
ncbi:MAG TPA: hypothetical protein VEL07_20950 [Planctomycetota bacterium]|nr:hypothetical protein [Planctomycetota bacterium]